MIESVLGEIPIFMNIFATGSTIVSVTYGLSELAAIGCISLIVLNCFSILVLLPIYNNSIENNKNNWPAADEILWFYFGLNFV